MQALLYIAAEDEALMALNREMDACSLLKERRDASIQAAADRWESVEDMPLAGKTITQWLNELDAISKEVEAELVPRDIGCHLVEVLEAVNVVLFELRGFKRSSVLNDPKCSYLHSVLSTGCGSGKALYALLIFFVCLMYKLGASQVYWSHAVVTFLFQLFY